MHHSGAARVTAMPAAMTTTASGTTTRRPTRSASQPAPSELAEPSR
jgi:hypothetical protein